MFRALAKHWARIDSTSSFISWAWWLFLWAFGLSGAVVMGWLSSEWDSFWQTFGWFGVAAVSLITWFLIGLGLTLYRFALGFFWKTDKNNDARTANASKYIKSVQLVPSGEDKLVLVIEPACGGQKVEVYVRISPWRDGGSFLGGGVVLPGWTPPQKLYLGDVYLRAEGIKSSLDVLDLRPVDGSTPDQNLYWMWRSLRADGSEGTARFLSMSHRERVIFVVVPTAGVPEEFRFLLARRRKEPNSSPIIISPSEFDSWNTAS